MLKKLNTYQAKKTKKSTASKAKKTEPDAKDDGNADSSAGPDVSSSAEAAE